MIRVSKIISWSDVNRPDYARLDGIRRVNVSVRNLRRSVDFYTRVFGLLTVNGGDGRTQRPVVMAVTDRADLVIHEWRATPVSAVPVLRRWGFVVTNVDRVRQMVWDFGVDVARDSGEPDHIYRRSNGSSLYIHDPDGNEIELFAAEPDLGRVLPTAYAYI